MTEQLVEDYTGSLSADIGATDLSLTLSSDPGLALPASGNFRVRLHDADETMSEVILVTGRAGAVLSWPSTANRGIEDPTGARPARGWLAATTIVEVSFTKGALEQWHTEHPPTHAATTGQGPDDHHAEHHTVQGGDHTDVATTTPADGNVLAYVASTGKWTPRTATGSGFVHAMSSHVDIRYVWQEGGSDTNNGLAEGDPFKTLAKAYADLDTAGNGEIRVLPGPHYISDNPADGDWYNDYANFYHKAQLNVIGYGSRDTQFIWKGGDGTRSNGTLQSASAGDTTLNAAGGSTWSTADVNRPIRLTLPIGVGGANVYWWTWIVTRVSSSQVTISEALPAAVSAGAAWTVIAPKSLWSCGARDFSQNWGATGLLDNVKLLGDDAVPYGQHLPNFAYLQITNGQNGASLKRVTIGDKADDGSGNYDVFQGDGMWGVYAMSPGGEQGLGMVYTEELWIFGGCYPFFSGFSANPVILQGASSTGPYGIAQIYVCGDGTANLLIPEWKTEMRPRNPATPGEDGTHSGNPEETNGVPFLIDVQNPLVNLEIGMVSAQQESGTPSFVPNIPVIRYQSSSVKPAIGVSAGYATKFPNLFSATNQGTKYDVPFPNTGARRASFRFGDGSRMIARTGTSGTPTGPAGEIIVIGSDLWYVPAAGGAAKKLTGV